MKIYKNKDSIALFPESKEDISFFNYLEPAQITEVSFETETEPQPTGFGGSGSRAKKIAKIVITQNL
jgi:hypothetical protein